MREIGGHYQTASRRNMRSTRKCANIAATVPIGALFAQVDHTNTPDLSPTAIALSMRRGDG